MDPWLHPTCSLRFADRLFIVAGPLAVSPASFRVQEDSLTAPTILLVDDNPNDVELALDALDACGIREGISVAPGGTEAVALLRGGIRPDLILLDLKMPNMDGLAVLDAVRSDPRTRMIPVVMLTTSGEERDIADCYRHGATAYVIKPLDFTQFRATVRTITDFWANLNRRPT